MDMGAEASSGRPERLPGDPVGGTRRRRAIDSSTLVTALMYLPVVPVSLLGLALVALPLQHSYGVHPGLTAATVVGIGLLPLIPLLTGAYAWMLGARRPTMAEMERLTPLWDRVLQRSGRPGARAYRLFIEDVEDLNAYAAGGWLVAVTTGALRLPDDELEAVLAHELGHHLGGHTLIGSLQVILMLPVWFIDIAMRGAARVIYLVNVGSWFFRLPVVNWISIALMLLLRLVVFVLGLLVQASALLTTMAGRRSEILADRTAVDLGYGESLKRALDRFRSLGLEADLSRVSSLQRAMHQTHPPLGVRIERIEQRLRNEP